MTLYEIDGKIDELTEHLADPETGEVNQEVFDELQALIAGRPEKVEAVCLVIKNKRALAAEIKAERDRLKEREDKLLRDAERLSDYLQDHLHGEKFETAKVSVTYRRSTSVEIKDPDIFCDFYAQDGELVTRKMTATPNKANIKKLLTQGREIVGAAIVEHTNMTIK